MTPGFREARVDWADDKAWANYAENMATVAWLAKQGGLKGLMLDPEEYGAQGGSLPQYIHTYRDPPFEECAKLARQRGREVFSRVEPLVACGLEAPPGTELLYELSLCGCSLPSGRITVSECADTLEELLSGKRG